MVNNSVAEGISDLEKLVYQEDIDLGSVISVLQKLTGFMRSPETKSELSKELWEPITKLSKVWLKILSKDDKADNEVEFLTEVLRFLRNCCCGSRNNQNFILSNHDLSNFAKLVLSIYSQKESDKEVLVLKVCIQLFGNILVGNENSKTYIWSLFYGENYFRLLLQHKDLTIQECVMMVLFNCMTDETSDCILSTRKGLDILLYVTNTLVLNQIDWGMLFIEYLLKQNGFFNCYPGLPRANRLLILDIVAERLKSSQDDCSFAIPLITLEVIKFHFLRKVSELYNKVLRKDLAETVSMLSILCSASISDVYIPNLQKSQDLLHACVDCLKCIHLLGKESSNMFSCLSETKHMSSQFSAEIVGHPLYGFKKNLIRLIGNLCCNCRENQDLVRNLDGIPLVLDCCKFDAKNPYITQWCILAIRNIMENNAENQAILAGMSVSGEIADSSYLREMGFQVQNENGKLHIKPQPF